MARNDFSLVGYYGLEELDSLDSEELRERFAHQPLVLVFWKDHIAEYMDVRVEKDLGRDENDNPILQHERFDGAVFQEGTPVNAENLAQMEHNDLINYTKILKVEDIIRGLQVQVATLIGQNNNNMPYNSFVASAKNINTEIEIVEGWYDEVNGRGVV